MSERNITLPVLQRARAILRQRGWACRFSAADDGAINIRSAISIACREIAASDKEWYSGYLSSVATLRNFLDDGVTSWEFGTHASKPRPRQEDEVFQVFDKVIARLESDEAKARVSTGSGNSSSNAV